MLTTKAQIRLNIVKLLLRKVPYINCGGCGIAAYVLYNVAKQVAPEADIKIMYLYNSPSGYYDNKSVIENNDLSGVHAPSHCFITVDGEQYDTSKSFSMFDEYTIEVTLDFLVHSIQGKGWNTMFNRTNCKQIEKFSNVELLSFYKDSIYAA